MNIVFNQVVICAIISESLKMGLLTPVFKTKGTRQQAINNRGIIVLPVIVKIVEAVIKCRTNNCVLEIQNKRQTGFTAGSSPMNVFDVVALN
jgi:hypothetical protein